jgi:hypothetical protein
MPHLIKLHLFDGCWNFRCSEQVGLPPQPLLHCRSRNPEQLGDKPIGGFTQRIENHRKRSLDSRILLDALIPHNKIQAATLAAITLLSSYEAVLDEILAITLLAAVHKCLL